MAGKRTVAGRPAMSDAEKEIARNYGKRLRELRELRGQNQGQLSVALGQQGHPRDQRAISKWEKGLSRIPEEIMRALQRIGYNTDYIKTGERSCEKTDIVELRIEYARVLGENNVLREQCEKLEGLINALAKNRKPG